MMNVESLILLVTVAAGAFWLWHSYGIREHALAAVRRHCAREEVELLDDNVAFQRIGMLPDRHGRKRLGRLYGFEFTVTGEQRYPGQIVMFGSLVGSIEFAPHVARLLIDTGSAAAMPMPMPAVPAPTPTRKGEVIRLEDWRKLHGTRQTPRK
ncbi:DUF3301 domain-containing protein [Azomonas macrocytogenes]|uniref:DUF3301 domain-containing protein n=1 Tax=Azomonas macrocytogenes TaxID=69962 RepID=A0A839T0R0_AZOMA|nr:DUF3301 domain-containing protein [Azomonas macrocytogenes]MBB3103131.1 hypothetical protein [Azomonas macrocytogenes]